MSHDKRYKRQGFLRLVGDAAASFALSPSIVHSGRRTSRPNIVLIVADDWAYMDLGTAGHPLLKTPNPICMPGRAALPTGEDNWTNGCWFFGMPITNESKHFAELLSEAGYETFYTGKWHNEGLPSKRGFTSGKYIGGGENYEASTIWLSRQFHGDMLRCQ
jgi:arylsulfatase A-like enzyme